MVVNEDTIVKKMVAEIVDSNEKFMSHSSQDMENFKRIVPVLLEKGIDNVNLSMFDDATRGKLLNALGEEYVRRGDMNNSVNRRCGKGLSLHIKSRCGDRRRDCDGLSCRM